MRSVAGRPYLKGSISATMALVVVMALGLPAQAVAASRSPSTSPGGFQCEALNAGFEGFAVHEPSGTEVTHRRPSGLPSNGAIASTVGDGSAIRLFYIPYRRGGPFLALPDPHGLHPSFEDFAWSPDGRLLAATVTVGCSAVVVIDPAESTVTRLAEEADASGPVWSPDGTRLVYLRDREVVVLIGASGGDAVELGSPASQGVVDVAWAPDGRRLLVRGVGLPPAWVIDPEPGARFEGLAIDGFGRASWLPDGRIFAWRLGGPITLLDPDAPDGERRTIPVAAAFAAATPDGQGALVISPEGEAQVVSLIDGRPLTSIEGRIPACATEGCGIEGVGWSPDGSQFHVRMGDDWWGFVDIAAGAIAEYSGVFMDTTAAWQPVWPS